MGGAGTVRTEFLGFVTMKKNEQKQPWEMTLSEYAESKKQSALKALASEERTLASEEMRDITKKLYEAEKNNPATTDARKRMHRNTIKNALLNDRLVPAEVLKEYPDLEEEYMPRRYEAIKEKLIDDGMPVDEAKERAAKIHNSRNPNDPVYPAREVSLMPDGIPRYIRVYDDPEYIDRYTVVFTGKYRHKTGGQFMYLAMSGNPRHPKGIFQHGSSNEQLDTKKSSFPPEVGQKCHLGKRIRFEDLPKTCQNIVIEEYEDLWGI